MEFVCFFSKAPDDKKVKWLRFTWDPPAKTNGPILTYTISYRSLGEIAESNTTGAEVIIIHSNIHSIL